MTSFKLLRAVRTYTGLHTTVPPDLWCLNSPDLNPADYSFWSIMQENVYCVPDTHSEHGWAETSANSGVGGAGPQTLQLSDRDSSDAVSMRVTRVWKLRRDILTNICVEFTCRPSPLGYLLNSWPMKYLALNFATRHFECLVSYYCRFCAFCVWYGFNSS